MPPPTIPAIFVLTSALIVLVLGVLHLAYTFRGDKFYPRDPEVLRGMQAVSPRISRQTTMWKAWIGFNASHSYGAILFGLIYGYFALAEPSLFFGSWFLQSVGLALLAGYVFLGKRYWFSVPFRGVCAALLLYVLALAGSGA